MYSPVGKTYSLFNSFQTMLPFVEVNRLFAAVSQFDVFCIGEPDYRSRVNHDFIDDYCISLNLCMQYTYVKYVYRYPFPVHIMKLISIKRLRKVKSTFIW